MILEIEYKDDGFVDRLSRDGFEPNIIDVYVTEFFKVVTLDLNRDEKNRLDIWLMDNYPELVDD